MPFLGGIIGFKKRLTTLLHWTVSFLGRSRSERAITKQQATAREALELLGESWSAFQPSQRSPAETPQQTRSEVVQPDETDTTIDQPPPDSGPAKPE